MLPFLVSLDLLVQPQLTHIFDTASQVSALAHGIVPKAMASIANEVGIDERMRRERNYNMCWCALDN